MQLSPNGLLPQSFLPYGLPEVHSTDLERNNLDILLDHNQLCGLYPMALNVHSHSMSGRNTPFPQASLGGTCVGNDEFWMNLHLASSAGSSSLFSDQPHQRTPINGAPSSTPTPPARTRRHDVCGSLAGSSTGLVACQSKGETHPRRSLGAASARDFPDTVRVARHSRPEDCPIQSPFPAFPPFPPMSAPDARGHPYQAATSRPVASSGHDLQSNAGPSVPPSLQQECAGQAESTPTLRSIRTRFGDVYAAYESCKNRTGRRWVCQCGSTFVRDSDWERHAVHSLSHSTGGGFDCSICDISFTRSDAMFRHWRKKHGDLGPSTQETVGAEDAIE